METTDDQDAGDYDKTFLEEPAILDKYKAAAEVCESKSNINISIYIKSKIKRYYRITS